MSTHTKKKATMNNLWELKNLGGKLIYPVLQHYTGTTVTDVFLQDNVINFNTISGESGKILESIEGEVEIFIGGEVVYSVEKEVFEFLVIPQKSQILEDRWEKMNELINLPLKSRSSLLLFEIMSILKEYIINSDFNPSRPIRVDEFVVFSVLGIKNIICLN